MQALNRSACFTSYCCRQERSHHLYQVHMLLAVRTSCHALMLQEAPHARLWDFAAMLAARALCTCKRLHVKWW